MSASPAPAGRQRFDIAEIVRQHRTELEADRRLTLAQRRVLSAIEQCRTAALGGHVDVCRACGYEQPAYNSCRNRHCPKCQALTQERWIAARSERLLPTAHFHVVFTLPSELRALAKCRSRAIFDALLHAASSTLLELGASRLGATPAITMVLHTWTRDLRFHPHVHAIVSAGGLALDSCGWVRSTDRYLFPVRVMSALLRGKMMHALRDLYRRGKLTGFEAFDDPDGFDRLMHRLAKACWVVYAKKPFRHSEHVLAYLGRYTHRVAIANSRLVAVSAEAITFRTKQGKTVTVTPVVFLRRFIQHVLPDSFHKIRHYGLYSGSNVGGPLALARRLLAPPASTSVAPTSAISDFCSWQELLGALTNRDVDHCPRCGATVEHVPVPAARAPPVQAVG